MRRELKHYMLEDQYGWNQDWFPDWFLRMGGCAAVTACDACVYLALRKGKRNLVPFDPAHITRADFLTLSRRMKPFLHPRMRGIDKLSIYQEGLGGYLRTVGETGLRVDALPGTADVSEAEAALTRQIDAGYPIPFLTLRHKDPALSFYEWHWYLLMGYDIRPDGVSAQAVTYGKACWLDFRSLWDTGFSERGGMILLSYADDAGTVPAESVTVTGTVSADGGASAEPPRPAPDV